MKLKIFVILFTCLSNTHIYSQIANNRVPGNVAFGREPLRRQILQLKDSLATYQQKLKEKKQTVIIYKTLIKELPAKNPPDFARKMNEFQQRLAEAKEKEEELQETIKELNNLIEIANNELKKSESEKNIIKLERDSLQKAYDLMAVNYRTEISILKNEIRKRDIMLCEVDVIYIGYTENSLEMLLNTIGEKNVIGESLPITIEVTVKKKLGKPEEVVAHGVDKNVIIGSQMRFSFHAASKFKNPKYNYCIYIYNNSPGIMRKRLIGMYRILNLDKI